MASFGDVFKKICPMLSMALSFVPGGGVAAQIASSVVSSVTGKSAGPAELQDVMTNLATSEQGRIQLQQIETAYQQAMAQMGFDSAEKMAELMANDRDSARKMQEATKSAMPAVLAILAVVGFVFSLCLLAFVNLPAASRDAVMVLLGCEVAAFKDVYGYYFGSSVGAAIQQASGAATSSVATK